MTIAGTSSAFAADEPVEDTWDTKFMYGILHGLGLQNGTTSGDESKRTPMPWDASAGGGFTRTSWGFRKYPWANMQAFTLLYSTGYNNVRATYVGQWRLSDTSLIGAVGARFSGIENMNFYGFGNETPDVPEILYRLRQMGLPWR